MCHIIDKIEKEKFYCCEDPYKLKLFIPFWRVDEPKKAF
jgi:hypothetical protein